MNNMVEDYGNFVYRQRIDNSINGVHLAGIATKILQHMDRVRNVSDLSQARRWVMELLQNAKDASYKDQPVRVKIQLNEDTLTFSHNGRPFQVMDILSIINQVSSKNADDNTVGKFGTGFVTTFQLSEKVEIHSVLQEGELPYKRFQVTLDRTGRDNAQILEAISNAMEELRDVDNAAPVMDFDRNAYNTEFVYHLESAENKKAAKVGMEDLQHSVFYIFLFAQKIQEITLEYCTAEKKEKVIYRKKGEAERICQDVLKRMNFEMCREEASVVDKEVFSLVYMKRDTVTLAAGWQQEKGFLPLSEYTPRLFVNFPLIGAEQFPFPVVIESNFKTNEPRSGITLVDNVASVDSLVNKGKIEQAVQMYGEFLHAVVEEDMLGLENILYIPKWQENREMSENWVKAHIYKALYKKIAQEAFLNTGEKKRALSQMGVCLIAEREEAVRESMIQLCTELPQMYVPEDKTDWYAAMENYPLPDDKGCNLKQLLERADNLIGRVREEPLKWLQRLYDLGMSQEQSSLAIRTGEVRILPNQADWEHRKLFAITQLKHDPGIPEILKDVSESLDMITPSNMEEPLKLRERLLHKDFAGGNVPELGTFELAKLVNYLEERTNRSMRVYNYSYYWSTYERAREKAWLLMLSCGPDKAFYHLGKAVFGEKLAEYQRCEVDWNASVWRHTYIALAEKLLDEVAACGKLTTLREKYFETEEEAIDWLNLLLEKGREYYWQGLDNRPVFLNQKGVFCDGFKIKRDLTQEESLKDIAEVFADRDSECDFREKLLDRRIVVKEGNYALVTEEMIAQRINQVLQQILRMQNLADTSMEYQLACTKLLEWMNEHENLADSYFPAFTSETDKVRLMTPNAVIALQKGQKLMDKVLKEAGVDKPEELLAMVERLKALDEARGLQDTMADTRSGRLYWSEETDVFFGEDFWDYEEEERRNLLRTIGIAGEKYGFSCIKNYCVEQGAEVLTETEQEICLQQTDGSKLTLLYGDKGAYHQVGWDVKVTLENAQGEQECYYVEIKTHTLGSRKRGELALSTQQMKMAINEREHYVVLSVDYDHRQNRGAGCSAYIDPLKCFARDNSLLGQERYFFQEVK